MKCKHCGQPIEQVLTHGDEMWWVHSGNRLRHCALEAEPKQLDYVSGGIGDVLDVFSMQGPIADVVDIGRSFSDPAALIPWKNLVGIWLIDHE